MFRNLMHSLRLLGQGHLPAVPDRARPQPTPVTQEAIQIDLVHVNDLHGAVDPMLDGAVGGDSLVGGLSRLKTAVDRTRAENPQGTLLLNAGDLAEGSMIAYLTRGRSVAEAMKPFKFDAVALGNHDFAWGQAALSGMIGALGAPIVAANVVKTSDGTVMDGAAPYVMKQVQGVNVAVIGLDTPNIRHYVADEKLEGLDFKGGAETVARYLPEVRAKGADVVVVLSHMGFEEDRKLARDLPGIDVIVGGHSHTRLPEGHREGDTLIVQAGSLSKFMGRATLHVDPSTRRIIQSEARIVPVLVDELSPDPEVERILAPYMAEAEQVGSRPMGLATENLRHGHREAHKLNQIHADSLLKASGADLGICNSRTLRNNVPKGEVTFKDLYSALPFTEENCVVLRATGREVLAEIEDDLRDSATELAIPTGLRYEYDPSRPEGSRVVGCTLPDGSPLDMDREYTVVMNETMSKKKVFHDAPGRQVLGPVQPLFFEAFQQGSPWSDDADDRVRRLEPSPA